MKTAVKSSYFYNFKNSLSHPLFYITAILFSVFTSAYFFIKLQFFSEAGTTDLLGFFSSVPYICILVIPALCFKHSSSVYEDFIPLKQTTKLFVKFSSIFTQYLFLLLLLLVVPFMVSLCGDVEWGQVFTSFFCLIFYGCAEIALCLFFVEFFENNIASFVVNAVILAICNSAHLFTIYIPMNSFFVSVMKTLSFAWHFDAAGKGIIDSRDICWFVFSAFLFLNLTVILKLKKMGKKFIVKEKVTVILSACILLLLFLNSSRYFFRVDCSKNKNYSISAYTKRLLSTAQGNIKITWYRSSNLVDYYPQIRDISDFLQSYATDSSVSLLIIDPDKDNKALTLLQNYGVTSQPMRSIKNSNTVEYVNVYSSIFIEYNGNTETIPYILSSQTLEYDLDGRIKHLLTNKIRLVNVIIGNELSLYDSNGYNLVIPWLNSQGFICNPIIAAEEGFDNALKNTTGPLLVIGDNQIKVDQAVAIENYLLANNENALFTLSPFSLDFSNWKLSSNQNTNLVELIENWGVIFQNKIAADLSSAKIVMESQAEHSENYFEQENLYREEMNYPLFISILPQNNTNLGVTEFWASPLELESNNYEVSPYLITSPYSWSYEIQQNKQGNLIETNPFVLRDDDVSGKTKESQILGAMIKGSLNGLYTAQTSEDSTIIVIPDQYFLSTILNYGYIGGEYGDYRNFEFLTNCLLKLNGEEELAQLQGKTSRDTSLYKLSDASSSSYASVRVKIYSVCFILLPVIVLLLAVVFWGYRKKESDCVKK